MPSIGDLKPDKRNARRHTPRNVGMIQESIQRHGFGRSILTAKDGTIIAGNATWEAAGNVGIEDRIVVESDGTKVIEVRRTDVEPNTKAFHELSHSDNRTAELAETDALVFSGLIDDGLIDPSWMYHESELDAVLASLVEPVVGLTDPDAVPEVPKEAATRPGDVWVLGRHRLMCGDLTNPNHVDALLDGAKPDVVYTDPPYGINAVTGNRGQWGGVAERYRPVLGDMSGDVAKDAFRLISAMNVPVQIFWGANHYCSVLPDSSCWIVWYKRDGADANDFADCELAWTNQASRARLFHHVWNGFLRDSEKDEGRVHPTQKPTALVEWCLQEYGQEGDLVLDLFGGSGSTLVACERTKRTVYLMEIDPGYCDVIVTRWQDFTGQTAALQTAHAEAAG